MLADLLRQVDAEEIAEVTYLLQGRVAPLYEPIEFGLGERSIEKALAQAYDVTPAEARQRYAQHGDLGLVVEELSRAHALRQARVSERQTSTCERCSRACWSWRTSAVRAAPSAS